jgi:hypothetical protein
VTLCNRTTCFDRTGRNIEPESERVAEVSRRPATINTVKERHPTMKIGTTSKKLKATMLIDAAPIAALRLSDNAPSRIDITVMVGGRAVTASIASKSLRKCTKVLADHGADNVAVILQGVLTAGDILDEAGLVAQVKVQAAPQAVAG